MRTAPEEALGAEDGSAGSDDDGEIAEDLSVDGVPLEVCVGAGGWACGVVAGVPVGEDV